MIEPTQWETEYDQDSEQGLDTLIAKAQGGGPLPFDLDGTKHPIKRILANRAIVRYFLDVEKTSVGPEADLPQGRQVFEKFADAEAPCVVDGCLGAQGAPFFVILLDPGVLVVDMQRSAAL